MKKKKPKFVRQEAYKRKRLSRTGWKKPKGMHSKMRRKKKGKRKSPSVGYSSPKAVRGLTREGFKPVLVKTLKDLDKIKENEIIILSRTLGLRKRLQLLEKIKQLKLKIQNIKNIDKFIKQAKENQEKKKKEKKEKKKSKQKKPKETKKKQETEEEKEKREKEEKRKILEQK